MMMMNCYQISKRNVTAAVLLLLLLLPLTPTIVAAIHPRND
jgi:hypothetical protein